MGPRRRLFATLVASAVLLGVVVPSPADAHVNRYVGPYAFFLVMIEEPTFETNRAGFEFWVHDGNRVVPGLDRTLAAVASTTSRQVALAIAPINERGFYDVETDLSGTPFDPGAAGEWTLRLTGTVEGTSVDVRFPQTFPAYPRVATATRPAAVSPADSGPDVWLAVDAGLLALFGAWFGRKEWRRRLRQPIQSSQSPGSARPMARR